MVNILNKVIKIPFLLCVRNKSTLEKQKIKEFMRSKEKYMHAVGVERSAGKLLLEKNDEQPKS